MAIGVPGGALMATTADKIEGLEGAIDVLSEELREWDGTNVHERARKVERLWRLRSELHELYAEVE